MRDREGWMVYKYVKIVKIWGTCVVEVWLWTKGMINEYLDFGVIETDDSGMSKKEAILIIDGIFQIMSILLTFP